MYVCNVMILLIIIYSEDVCHLSIKYLSETQHLSKQDQHVHKYVRIIAQPQAPAGYYK